MMPLVALRRAHGAVRLARPALPLAALAVLAGCTSSGQAAEAPVPVQDTFVGTLVYQASAGGPNREGAETFSAFGPSREVVTWGSGGRLRLETTGGMFDGILVARMAESAYFSLDTAARVARAATVQSLNREDMDPDTWALMEERLGPPVMERTDEEGSYAGRRCRVYAMLSSGMLRRGATARACVAEDVRVRPSRYHFEWPGGMGQMVALPLQYGIREGLPLMVEVNEDGTIVTYRAVSLTPGEPADALFSVPPGYTIAEPEEDG
ncbi:MAG TPA: hypothetical protein VFR37_22085 [Longimicrobium sp.]|nr:hypothetical protein [Longimicrobium sp.]